MTETAPVPVDVALFERQLEVETRRLVDEFRGRLSPEIVRAEMEREIERHRGAKVRTFVPIFASRRARETLTRLARPTSVPLHVKHRVG